MTFLRNFLRNLRRRAWLPVLALLICGAAQGQAQLPESASTAHVRATLLAHAPDGVGVGKTVWLGLELVHQPQWHTYWKNPGDAGLLTTLRWTLPAGVSAGEVAWPLPQKIKVGPLTSYGYEGTVLLAVPLTISPAFKPTLLNNTLAVGLQASWLVCRLECIPEEVALGITLPLRSSVAAHGARFEETLARQPQPLSGQGHMRVQGQRLQVSVAGLPSVLMGRTLEAFPETPELIEPSAAWSQAWQGAVWTASLPLLAPRHISPPTLALVLSDADPQRRQGYVATLQLQGDWPALVPSPVLPSAALTPDPTLQAPLVGDVGDVANASRLSLWAALLGALLGGLILNLMPCVFPVLAIKVLSFTRPSVAGHSHRLVGLAYSAGVVLSFVGLGALMLLLRGIGTQLGWGFQLQLPLVVAGLAVLFTLLGLNLSGLFEFGQVLPSRWVTFETRHPSINAFLSGVLAVAVASPCTAPFMGASLGLALSLPASQTLLIFASLGVGMASPFLLVSWVPALARGLPKPGAWMATFRHAMAFPMYATVVWLVWVLGQQSGVDGAAALLALLLALSAVVWAFTLSARSRLWLGGLLLILLGWLFTALGPYVVQGGAGHAVQPPNSQARWQKWAPQKVTALLASGQPVFVDFTAAWCVTCQYNKKTTLADSSVLADMDAKKVVTLRADWTLRNPVITQALSQLGRNGVPVYVLYAPNQAPVVLSEILTVSEVRAALARL